MLSNCAPPVGAFDCALASPLKPNSIKLNPATVVPSRRRRRVLIWSGIADSPQRFATQAQCMFRLACEARQSGMTLLEPVDVSGLCLRRESVKRYVFTDCVDTLRYKDGHAA